MPVSQLMVSRLCLPKQYTVWKTLRRYRHDTSVSYCTRIPFGCFVSDRRDIRPPTYKIFEGIYTGSDRVPDLALQIEYGMRVREVKFVIEVLRDL